MNYLEVFGTLVGLAYLWLEYKASIYLWIASIIMPAIYIIVYYQAGLYADFGINIYYLIASVYGWIIWKKQQSQTDNIPQNTISCMPKSRWYPLVGITTLLFAAIAWILIRLRVFNTTLIFFYLQIDSKQLENNLLVSKLSLLRIKLWQLYYFYKW